MALVELAQELELVEVQYDGGKATLTFFDEEQGLIREVNFNKQKYDTDKKAFVDDADKAAFVEEKIAEHLNVTFDTLTTVIGQCKDIYVYEGFSSLYPVEQIEKFTDEQVGDIFSTEIESIEDTGIKISVKYKYEDKIYETKLTYANYLESMKKYLVDPNKKEKTLKRFETHYGVPIERKDELIGKQIMVEVKQAFQKFNYGEIKKLKAAK